MKPYYEHGGITIFHGDGREVAASARFDAVVTDPPYGIALDTASRWPWLKDHPPVEGDNAPFDPGWLVGLDVPSIIWGANHFASRLPDSKGWLAWDKATKNGLDLKQAEIEFAWSNCVSRPRAFRHMWSGAFRESEQGTRFHPCQKPVRLMQWCISLLPSSSCIFDPYMGSGPTLISAKMLGKSAVGCDVDERYCAIAAHRLSQEVLPLNQGAT